MSNIDCSTLEPSLRWPPQALQALKDKDDAESRRLEAPHPRERSTSPVGEWKRLNGMPSCEESLRVFGEKHKFPQILVESWFCSFLLEVDFRKS